jgi:hypothetical protein
MATRDTTILNSGEDKNIIFSDGSLVSGFWTDCKSYKRCAKTPFDRLLSNMVLKTDYDKYLVTKMKKMRKTELL